MKQVVTLGLDFRFDANNNAIEKCTFIKVWNYMSLITEDYKQIDMLAQHMSEQERQAVRNQLTGSTFWEKQDARD
jgi:hypothetical protein